VQRYNSLLALVKSELGALKRAILGLQAFDEHVQQTCNTLLLNRIPEHWEERTGIKPSADTLGSMFADLMKRLNAVKRWIYEQQPIVFWLPMFANPRAFLAALLQN